MQELYSPKNGFRKPTIEINWQKFWKIIGYLAGAGAVIILGVFLFFAKDLPSPGTIGKRNVVESTKIYDRTGNHLLYDIHGEEKRTQISFKEMPDTIKYATIALEDQNFYNHPGFDVRGLASAVLSNVVKIGDGRGGSTITQQFVKNSILTNERSLSRKIKELILAIEIEWKFSKDEILEMYLNQIPYGSNAYGIEAGAQTFFGKHALELTLDESALLAALPQAPSYYSPYGNHNDALKGRQMHALTQMAKLGYITQEQADAAKEVDILSKIKAPSENISAPHFVMYIKEYLENKYGEQAVEKGGLKVYTTLDWDKQQIAEQAVREGAESNLKKYDAENAALVAIDPKTGQILSMVGSKNYFDKSIDGQVNVAIRDRQPGSSFKPYVYLTAFTKGYTPETQLWDVDTNFSTDTEKDYNPKNYDGKNQGLLQMKNALAMSLNVPAVKTLYLAGVQDSINMAKSLGITTLNKPQDYGLSLVLGGGEVKLLDHVNAFGTLATGGIKHEKIAILKILDSSGKILEEYRDAPGQRVVEEKYIAMLDSVMSNNDLRAPVFGENNPLKFTDRPVAAKTGTTNEWRDGWTMGFTPSLAVGVWTGNNDNSTMAQGADGIYTAAPIWRKFMDDALKNSNVEQFPKYNREEMEKDPSFKSKDVLDGRLAISSKLNVCKVPDKKDEYCLASDACPDSETDKKEFFTAHNILYYVNIADPRGDAPEDPEKDSQYKNWEKAVEKWVDKNTKLKTDDVPTEECKSSDFSDYKASVGLDASASLNILSIHGSISAPYGIKNASLTVDGNEISQPGGSFNITYTVPVDKNNSTLRIKLTVTDKNNNSASAEKNVPVAF